MIKAFACVQITLNNYKYDLFINMISEIIDNLFYGLGVIQVFY